LLHIPTANKYNYYYYNNDKYYYLNELFLCSSRKLTMTELGS